MAKKKQARAPRGTGSFRTRANGTLEYRIGVKDEYGRTKRKCFYGTTKEECLSKYEQFLIDEERKSRGIAINATIPELIEARFRLNYELNFTNEQGFYRSMETLQIIQRSGLAYIPIAEVTKEQLQHFLISITKYANSTIEKIYLQLKKAYQEAINQEIITRNLMLEADVRRPKSDKADKKVRGYSPEEQKILIDAIHNHKIPYSRSNYKRQLLIELYTGLRMGEINALRPEDIDFDRKLLTVSRTISTGKGKQSFINTTTKTNAGLRTIPITKDAEDVLREAIEAMQPNPEGLIFYDYNKMDVVSTKQVNSFFKRICDKTGLEYNGQHALRHTFATRCIESGIDAFVLKNWMGHTDIHVTLDTYADVFDALNNRSIRKLQDYNSQIISN